MDMIIHFLFNIHKMDGSLNFVAIMLYVIVAMLICYFLIERYIIGIKSS